MFSITSIDDDRIALYKTLKYTPAEHTMQKVFIAEGAKVVSNLLESSLETLSFFSTFDYFRDFAERLHAKSVPEEKIYIADNIIMNSIVGFKLHQGVLAIGREPENAKLSDLGETIVIFNGIVNSENVGAIVRNAVAFGANSIIYDSATSSPYMRRAVRVSMGNVFFTKIFKSENLTNTILLLKNRDYNIIGAEINNSSIPIDSLPRIKKRAIIFGSEGRGIEDNILALCDYVAHIPIKEEAVSINVTSASAIFLHSLNLD